MSTQIDFRTLPASIPSMCIPRVFANIDEKRIRRIFDELSMGEIQRIDIVSKTTEKGEKFNRVFVHFRRWFANGNADTARERLLNGKEIKIIYDDPWFWKVSAYREANQGPRPETRPAHKKASVQFDSDEDESSRHNNHSSRDTDEYGRCNIVRRNYDQRPRDDQRPRPNQRPQRPRDDRRPRDDQRPRDDRRPREDQRPRDDQRQEVKKVIVPRSPSNSPPRCREQFEYPYEIDNNLQKLSYEGTIIPVKKRNILAKKKMALKIEGENKEDKPNPSEEKEEGEITN